MYLVLVRLSRFMTLGVGGRARVVWDVRKRHMVKKKGKWAKGGQGTSQKVNTPCPERGPYRTGRGKSSKHNLKKKCPVKLQKGEHQGITLQTEKKKSQKLIQSEKVPERHEKNLRRLSITETPRPG